MRSSRAHSRKNGRSETLCEGKHLVFRRRGSWEYVERKGARPGVLIVALTEKGRLLLVEEPRPPVGRDVISLPAGLVGDEDASERPETAARRELLEETGYSADHLRLLGGGPTSPGLSSESVTFYLARNARRVSEPSTDEPIRLHVVAPTGVARWARKKEREGARIHPLLWAGLYLAGLTKG